MTLFTAMMTIIIGGVKSCMQPKDLSKILCVFDMFGRSLKIYWVLVQSYCQRMDLTCLLRLKEHKMSCMDYVARESGKNLFTGMNFFLINLFLHNLIPFA